MKKTVSLIIIFVLALTLVSCKETPKKLGPITLPAYTVENPQNNKYIEEINNTPKFQVTADWPEGCETRTEKGDKLVPTGDFYTPLYIYKGVKMLGYIAFDRFEPSEAITPQEDYYKTVYSKLRTSPVFRWHPYTMVKTSENSETGIVNIRYIDPADVEKFQGKLPKAPVHESYGILSYDKELKVYVGIALLPSTLTEESVKKLAKSVVITAVK